MNGRFRLNPKLLNGYIRTDFGDSRLQLKGKVHLEHFDSEGNLKAVYDFDNDIVNVGKNMIFNVMFNGATASTTWYIGLISNAGFTALAATDTMSSHGGWTEFTAYSQSTRVSWGSGSASAQTITNATAAQFDISSSGNIYGIFLVDNSTKGGTSGNMWATAPFNAIVPVNNGDQLKVTYTLSA